MELLDFGSMDAQFASLSILELLRYCTTIAARRCHIEYFSLSMIGVRLF